MTKTELSQLFFLNRDIERLQRQYAELKAKTDRTTAHITGLPRGTSDKTGLLAELADLSNLIEAKTKAAIAEYNRLNRYILTVDDAEMRSILALRFVNGLSWRQISFSIGFDGQEENIKKKCHRWLKKENEK